MGSFSFEKVRSEIRSIDGVKVEYCKYEGIDGEYFQCPIAVISVDFCKRMYKGAKKLKPTDISRWQKCVGCRIGAYNSGEKPVQLAVTKTNRHMCVRCHQFAFRLLSNGVCVSCSNRAAEVRKKANAKGFMPTVHDIFFGVPMDHLGKCKTVKLYDIEIKARQADSTAIIRADGVSSKQEAMMRISRQKRIRTEFSWHHKKLTELQIMRVGTASEE